MRGIAVLGILAVNVTGLWGPLLATFSPVLPRPEPGATAWFVIVYVLFEGKMRALFTLLFGASMVLFVEAAERRGVDGDRLQLRRLGWLALFGYLHYLLLWWGDILFPYALCGALALPLRRLPPASLAIAGAMLFTAAQGMAALLMAPLLLGPAPADRGMAARIAADIAADVGVLHAGFLDAVRLRLTGDPFLPFATTFHTFTETFPLMLIGMALIGSGFFSGRWSRRALARVAAGGIALGGVPALALAAWGTRAGWPPLLAFALVGPFAALPHLAMALGYAAALVLAWPAAATSHAGRALAAAGRCAFTNYIGTTVLMGALFSGWGLALGWRAEGGGMARGLLPLAVLLGWAAMLAWPQWWLRRFGQGPLEALWRRLTWHGVSRLPALEPAPPPAG